MPDKKLLIIANPKSGKAKVKDPLLRIVQIFSNDGYLVTVYPTKARGDATVFASQIKENEYDRIVVCGGDGTLNEVITGFMQSKLKCTIGYIPLGTLNEWSSSLNISRNALTAAKDILTGEYTQLDIGQFNDKFFTYTASFGAFTKASYATSQKVKNVLGQAAYLLGGIKCLADIKSIHLKFKYDDKEVEGDYLFGAISNSMSVGGVVKFKENLVKLNDGMFEVVLIKKPSSLSEFTSIVDGILRKDLTHKGIEFFHTSEITVIGGENVAWTLDGEYSAGSETVTIKNVPSALHLTIPNQSEKKSSKKSKE